MTIEISVELFVDLTDVVRMMNYFVKLIFGLT